LYGCPPRRPSYVAPALIPPAISVSFAWLAANLCESPATGGTLTILPPRIVAPAALAWAPWAAILLVVSLTAALIRPPATGDIGVTGFFGAWVATIIPFGATAAGVEESILMYTIEIIEMTSRSAIEIQAMVRNMDQSFRRYRALKNDNATLWAIKMKQENQTLYDEFPTIYNMHMNGKLDQTFFDMLQLKRKIEKGEMTEDEASVIVGQKLFNRYVDPVIKNQPAPPTLSYEAYYNNAKTATETVPGPDTSK